MPRLLLPLEWNLSRRYGVPLHRPEYFNPRFGLKALPTFDVAVKDRACCPVVDFNPRFGLKALPTCQHSRYKSFRYSYFNPRFGLKALPTRNYTLRGCRRVGVSIPTSRAVLLTCQRTSIERANSHAKRQFLDHPLVRTFPSVRHLNTLTCILINLKALQRAQSINTSLLPTIPLRN
jgi:hypothetical protein